VRGDTVQQTCAQKPLSVTVPQSTGPHRLLVLKLSVPLCDPSVVQVNRTVTVTLLPACTVRGSAGLTTANAGLFELMLLMVKDTLPQLLTVSVRSVLWPVHKVPKSIVRGETVQQTCAQKPLSVTVPQSTGPHRLLVLKLSVPFCDPDDVQVSRTVTVTLPPAGTFTGSAGLTTVNAGLFELIELMVKDTLPQLLIVKLRSALWPWHNRPKSIVRGEMLQQICAQKPLSVTVPQSTGPQMLLVLKLSVPLCEPSNVQVNRTVTVTLPPGDTVAGSAGLTTVNAGLFELMALRVKDRLPQLVTVNERSALWPRHNRPKSIVRGETVQQTCAQKPVSVTVPQFTGPQRLLVLKLRVLLCCPGEVQVNRTVTVTLVPGDTFTGSAGLTTLNAELFEVIALMVKGTLPQLLTVNARSALWPTHKVPKSTARGEMSQQTCAQKPLTVTMPQSTGPQKLLALKLSVPFCDPGVMHVNLMVTVTLPPGETLTGSAGLTTLNAELLELIALRVKG